MGGNSVIFRPIRPAAVLGGEADIATTKNELA
jgi:hypothetical protein